MSALLDHQLALATAGVRKREAARLLRGTVSIPRLASKRSVNWAEQTSQSQKCSRRRTFRRLPSKLTLGSEGKVSARNSLPSRRERKGTVHAGLAHLCNIGWVQSSLLESFGQRDSNDIARQRPKRGRHIRSF